jgi:hypothetical protein
MFSIHSFKFHFYHFNPLILIFNLVIPFNDVVFVDLFVKIKVGIGRKDYIGNDW